MRRCTRAGWRERTHLPGCIDARARWRRVFGHRVQHRTHCGVKNPTSISYCRLTGSHMSRCPARDSLVWCSQRAACRSVSVPDHNLQPAPAGSQVPLVRSRFPQLPVLHIADVTATKIRSAGSSRVCASAYSCHVCPDRSYLPVARSSLSVLCAACSSSSLHSSS